MTRHLNEGPRHIGEIAAKVDLREQIEQRLHKAADVSWDEVVREIAVDDEDGAE